MVLDKTLESPLDCNEIQPVHPKGDQSWVFIGWTDAEAETPILWPPHVKSWLIGKDPDAGRDWGQEEKGRTEDEMAGWHHWFDGHEFEQTPRVGDGQGGLACCDSWGSKESDTTEQLNWTELERNLGLAKLSRRWFLLRCSKEREGTLPNIPQTEQTKSRLRTSLVVQWLRLWTSMVRGTGSILGWETKIPQATQCGPKRERADWMT